MQAQALSNEAKANTPLPPNIWRRFIQYSRVELNDFLRFIRKPRRHVRGSITRREYWQRLVLFFLFGLALDFCFGLLFHSFDAFKNLDYKLDLSKVSTFLLAILFAPWFEELVFRAGLRGMRYTLFVGPLLIVSFSASMLVPAGMAVVVLILAVFTTFYLERPASKTIGLRFRLGRQFVQFYGKIFWLYAFAFAAVHIGNFKLSKASDLVVLLAVLPQFCSGLMWAYLRLRQGLMASIILHMAGNSLIAALVFFVK